MKHIMYYVFQCMISHILNHTIIVHLKLDRWKPLSGNIVRITVNWKFNLNVSAVNCAHAVWYTKISLKIGANCLLLFCRWPGNYFTFQSSDFLKSRDKTIE